MVWYLLGTHQSINSQLFCGRNLTFVPPTKIHLFLLLANVRMKHTVLTDTDKRALTSPSQLCWCIANKKGGKGKLYYACRVVDNPDQYKGLEVPNLKEGEVCVQYFDYAGAACSLKNYGNVRKSKLVPFYGSAPSTDSGDTADVDLTTVPWCPDLCALYEKQLEKELKSRIADAEERAVRIRVHLLFLPMALEHARAKEAETKRLTASQKKNAKRPRPTGCMSSNDIDAALADNEETAENDASSEDDGNEDDDDDDSLDPANKKRKTEILRPGDVLEFYHIMAVHGRKEDLRQAKIISVDPKEISVLIMDNGDCLPKDHQIRRIKKIHRGKLIDCDNASFRSVDYFRLSKAKLKEVDGNKILGAAHAKEARRVGEIINRNMTKLQEKAQADGFAPMNVMNKYKGGTSTERTKVDLSNDLEAAGSKQSELQQTINAATAPSGATQDDDRKPSAATSETPQRNDDDDDDGEKKTEEWTEI